MSRKIISAVIAFVFLFHQLIITPSFSQAAESGEDQDARLRAKMFYDNSWAVVIGIDKYEKWPSLESAVNDANAVEKRLRELGFNVIKLLNAEATRENISNVLGYQLPQEVKQNDRVFIFFAGHGHTVETFRGESLGYIIPVDADLHNLTMSISMDDLRRYSRTIKAKHLLYVMDSCYSGLGLTRSSGIPPQTEDYVKKITSQVARQMITAGQAGEKVAEVEGHGVFTKQLLQGLSGSADTHPDGIITASELGSYLKPKVSQASGNMQTPRYGRMPDDDDGEFIFILEEYFKEKLKAIKEREKLEKDIEIEQLKTKKAKEEGERLEAEKKLELEVERLKASKEREKLEKEIEFEKLKAKKTKEETERLEAEKRLLEKKLELEVLKRREKELEEARKAAEPPVEKAAPPAAPVAKPPVEKAPVEKGTLTVSTDPMEGGAIVNIDGEFAGYVPATVAVPAGAHKIEVHGEKRAGKAYVSVNAGATASVIVKLEGAKEEDKGFNWLWLLLGAVAVGGLAAAAGGSGGGGGGGGGGSSTIGVGW